MSTIDLITRIRLCKRSLCVINELESYARRNGWEKLIDALYNENVMNQLAVWRLSPYYIEEVLTKNKGDYPYLASNIPFLKDYFGVLLSHSLPPPPEGYIEEVGELLDKGLKHCRSADCALIKIGSTYYKVLQDSKEWGWDPREGLRKLLASENIQCYISILFNTNPSSLIRADVRHKILRPVADIVDEAYQESTSKDLKCPQFIKRLDNEEYFASIETTRRAKSSWSKPRSKRSKIKRAPTSYSWTKSSEVSISGSEKGKVGKYSLIIGFIILLLIIFYLGFVNPGFLKTITSGLGSIGAFFSSLFESQNNSIVENPYTGNSVYPSTATETLTKSTNPLQYTTSTTNNARNVKGTVTLRQELVDYALDLLNTFRREYGLPPVELMNLTIAQYRAEDMLSNKYFGHCDLNGLTANYWFTTLGGRYGMEENVGITLYYRSLRGAVQDHVYNMVFNDSASQWGHRDSLLDPTNNYVDIGIAWDGDLFYIVIHMLKVWVEWNYTPVYNPILGYFDASGTILLNNSKVTSVIIYRTDLSTTQYYEPGFGDKVIFTCDRALIGEPVAGVVPSSMYYYTDIETIVANTWYDSNGRFHISFTWRPSQPGIYTIVIYVENTLGVSHPFDKERYADSLPILEYTFKA